MHWQFGEMEFGEMKRNTSNSSNFGMLLRRAGLTASDWLSCSYIYKLGKHAGSVQTLCSYALFVYYIMQ